MIIFSMILFGLTVIASLFLYIRIDKAEEEMRRREESITLYRRNHPNV